MFKESGTYIDLMVGIGFMLQVLFESILVYSSATAQKYTSFIHLQPLRNIIISFICIRSAAKLSVSLLNMFILAAG